MTSFAACGLAVGHATDVAGATGCTVIRGDRAPFRCGVAVVGRATGTRELALLDPVISWIASTRSCSPAARPTGSMRRRA